MTTPGTVDPSVVAGIAAAARAVPGVSDAVAVVRHRARATPPRPAPVPAARVDHVHRPPAELDGGELRVPDGAATTLQEALRQAAELAPDKGTVFVTRDDTDTLQTYPELLAEAERVLAGLRATGLRPGAAVLFQFDDNRAYLTAFWACVLGGFVPTPVAVATTYRTPNETNRKLRNAWDLLDRPLLVTDTTTEPELVGVRELWGEPDVRIRTVAELSGCPQDTDWFPTTPDSPVLHLLTSGSTGVPKCVRHTNASVAARSWAVAQARGYTGDDVSVIWMPMDHVTIAMYNIRDVFLRCLHVNAQVDRFLGDPLRWLDWLDRFHATNTWAPNFAFALVNEHAEEIGRRHWDLRRMREFTNGGEPVVAATSHRFLDLLAPHGVPADAMAPTWGMSETCSGVTYAGQSRDDRTRGTVVVAPSSFDGDLHHVDPADPGTGQDSVAFSSVGRPVPGVRVRVVDAAGSVVPRERIGELQIRGATMMTGYHGNPAADAAAFDRDGWFRTGDLAFVHDDALVIAGRKKDQIVVRGINYVAHELESVVERVDGVRVSFSAAAGVSEPGAVSDRLVVFFVPTRWDADVLAGTCQEIRATLVREAGLAPDLLVPVSDTEFPKTTSGKVQRAALVADLRAGRFADRIDGDDTPVDGATWFCERRWSPLPDTPGSATDGRRLVFAADDVLPRLGVDGAVIAVHRGDGFAEEAADRFRVDPADVADVRRLLARVTALHGHVDTVVFALPLPVGSTGPATRLAEVTTWLTVLVRALADADVGAPALLVLTAGSVFVRPGDQVDLGVCAVPGLVRTAVAEAPLPVVRQLDLPCDDRSWPAAIRADLADPARVGVVAARAGRRWQARLRPVAESEADTTPPVVAGGSYLVTGGLGGIAHDIACYLLATYGVRLLLVGRSPVEGEKADRLAELTELGEVTYRRLDVADERALTGAVVDAEHHWGRPLDGVLHLAGADPTAQWAELERHTLVAESPDTFTALYRAKVSGTLAVGAVLADRPAASLVLFGSVNGEFGGHSFGAYAAANTFLVGFADHWHHERGRDVRCLAWSMWTDVGMNRAQPPEPAAQRGFRAIGPDDGLELFLTASALPQHYVLIGLDLANPGVVAELAQTELHASDVLLAYTATGADPETVRAALEPSLRTCPVPVHLMEVTRLPTKADGTPDESRLLLDAAPRRGPRRRYTAPATELERQIAVIWSDVLNRPGIGRDDSFFDLGGNSLRAAHLLARFDSVLAVRLTTHVLYENPTVAGLAAVISTG
jgi:acyl-CoA synthetase (AMP-forming)/AMP-acid ligase II/NADP-dependent 3-hydroxy acid dehydrogenase YdfG